MWRVLTIVFGLHVAEKSVGPGNEARDRELALVTANNPQGSLFYFSELTVSAKPFRNKAYH